MSKVSWVPKSGDVVTDVDLNSMFHDEQGEVVSVQFCLWEPPEVLVRFDGDIFWRYPLGDGVFHDVFEIHEPDELRLDSDWAPEVHARRLFGSMWYVIQPQEHPLDTTKDCLISGCTNLQKETVFANVYGKVYVLHACSSCAKRIRERPYMFSFPELKKA